MGERIRAIFLSIFQDENRVLSSKRLVGVISGLSLVVYSFIYPSDGANNSVLILALGCLSITSVDKYISLTKINKSQLNGEDK